MDTAMTRTGREYRKVGGMVLIVALTAMIGGLFALPARADNDDRGRNDQRERSYQEQRQPQRSYHREEPRRYVYAPPPVYYAAPERRPVIDLTFPLEFR